MDLGYDASGTVDINAEPRKLAQSDRRTTKSINFADALRRSLKEDFIPRRLHNDLKELNEFLLNWYRAEKIHDLESSTDNLGEYVYDMFEHLLYSNIVQDERKEELLRKFMPFIMSVKE